MSYRESQLSRPHCPHRCPSAGWRQWGISHLGSADQPPLDLQSLNISATKVARSRLPSLPRRTPVAFHAHWHELVAPFQTRLRLGYDLRGGCAGGWGCTRSGRGRDRFPHPPKWFESAEEPLDAPVLPGGEGSGALASRKLVPPIRARSPVRPSH